MTEPTELERQRAHLKKTYRNAVDALDDAIVEALCFEYKQLTGDKPSDNLEEKLRDAIIYGR